MNNQKDPNFIGFFILLALLIVALIAASVKFDVQASELRQYPYSTGTEYPNSSTAYVPTGYVYLDTPTPYCGTVVPELPPTSTPTPWYQYATATVYPTNSIFPPGTTFGPPPITTYVPIISPPPTEPMDGDSCTWQEELCAAGLTYDFSKCNVLGDLLTPTTEILIGCVLTPFQATRTTGVAMTTKISEMKPQLIKNLGLEAAECVESHLYKVSGGYAVRTGGQNGAQQLSTLERLIAAYEGSSNLYKVPIVDMLKAAHTTLKAAMKAAGCYP